MGFFKERKRAKELEDTYNKIAQGKKNIDKKLAEDKNIDAQAIYNECEEILKMVESAKVIVEEDLKKSGEVLANAWFAARDALAYEYNIHKKRLEVLKKYETEVSKIKTDMLEKGVQQESNQAGSQMGE